MALVTTDYLLQMAGIQNVTPQLIARQNLLRRAVEKAIKTYCKWELEQNSVTEYYDGTGKLELTLRNPYVVSVTNIWEDGQGNYGTTSGAFSAPPLTSGTDYALVYENGISRVGMVRRIQNSFLWWPGLWAPGYQQASGGLAYQYGAYWNPGAGNLKVQYVYGFPSQVPVASLSWSNGVVTVTTSVDHGFNVGMYAELYGCSPDEYNISNKIASVPSTTSVTMRMPYPPSSNSGTGGTLDGIPEDIKLAVVEAVAIVQNSTKYGYVLTSESMGDYNYSLSRDMEFLNVRNLLNPYRNTALGLIA